MTLICSENVLRVDFNGPLADMKEATRAALEIVTGLIIPSEQFVGSKSEILNRKTLFFPRDLGPRRYITEKDWEGAKSYIYDGHHFSSHVRPRSGICELLCSLSAAGWEVHVVTSCRGMTKSRLWKWINFHGVPVVSVNKSKDKFPHYSQGGVALDDEFRHLLPLVDVEEVTPILILDRTKHSKKEILEIKTLKDEKKLLVVQEVSEAIQLLLAA
jgi:hypothetical protein